MAEGPGFRYNAERRPRSKPNSLHHATETSDFPKIEAFIARGVKNGHIASLTLQEKEEVLGLMPIHIACEFGHLKLVEYLISKHVDLEAGDRFHVTPMHLAAIEGHADIVMALIKARCSSKSVDDEGDTPIHWAATKGNVDVIKVLKESRTPLDTANNSGWTPLHRAAYNGRKEATEYLIKAGASMTAKNRDGNTPLHLATLMNHIDTIEKICQCGCTQLEVNKKHETAGDLCLNDAARDVLMLYNWKKLVLGKDIPRVEEEVQTEQLDIVRSLGDMNFKSEAKTSRKDRDEGFPDLPELPKRSSRRDEDGRRSSSSATAFMQEAGMDCDRVSNRRAGPYGMRKSNAQ